jgi:hypothetical protein
MTSSRGANPALSARVAGRVAYRRGDGREIGREHFEIGAHPGGFTLRALCEMDDIGLLRDVTLALDPARRPLDGFCRITRDGGVAATTWFLVTPDALIFEGWIAGAGRMSQRLATSEPLTYLGLHPLICDALITAIRGVDAPGVFRTIPCITNSVSPNGDQGLYAMPSAIDVAYVGQETIDIAAGRFVADRFALRWKPDWPPADLWVRPEDGVFLLMRWSLIENWYELTAVDGAGRSA